MVLNTSTSIGSPRATSIASLRVPASVGRTKTGCKIPACPLTDRLQFDILQRGPGWRETNAIRSIETPRVHHATRRRGGCLAARGALAARRADAADRGFDAVPADKRRNAGAR